METTAPYHVQTLAEQKVLECFDIAKAKAGIDLQYEGVKFFKNSTMAGFVIPSKGNIVYLNLPLMERNESNFLNDTIPHEVAHLVANAIKAQKRIVEGAHGKTWKRVMSQVYGLNPTRCHQYDTSGVGRNVKKYRYVCSCQKFSLGSTRHNKIQNGAKYRCKKCKKELAFLYEVK